MQSDRPHPFGPQRGAASAARIEAQRKAILRELEAMRAQGSFVCSRCGEAAPVEHKADGTSECIYCW